jgi:hypothetical protein
MTADFSNTVLVVIMCASSSYKSLKQTEVLKDCHRPIPVTSASSAVHTGTCTASCTTAEDAGAVDESGDGRTVSIKGEFDT